MLGRFLRLGLLCGALAVAGCSSSGSLTVDTVQISGATRFANATIVIKEVLADGTEVVRATITTDANGNYTADFAQYDGGPLILTLTSGNTTLDSVVGAVNRTGNNNPPVAITLLTDVVLTRAQAIAAANGTGLNQTAVDQATSEIAALFAAINPITTQAIDLNDATAVANATADQRIYSAILAALRTLSGNDPAVAGNAFASTGGQAAIRADANVAVQNNGCTAGPVSLQGIVDGATQALNQAMILDQAGTLSTIQTLVVLALNDNTSNNCVSAVPSPNAGLTDEQKGQALAGDIGELTNEFEDLAGDPADQFVDEFETVFNGVIDDVDDNLFDALALALDEATDFFQDNDGAPGNRTLNSDGGSVANIALTAGPGSATTVAITGQVNGNDITFGGEIDSPTGNQPPAASIAVNNLAGTIETAAAQGLRLTVANGTINLTSNQANLTEENVQDATAADLNVEVQFSEKGPAQPVTFDGSVRINAVHCPMCGDANNGKDQDGQNILNPRTIILSGSFKDSSGEEFRATATQVIDNADTVDLTANDFPSNTNFVVGNTTLTLENANIVDPQTNQPTRNALVTVGVSQEGFVTGGASDGGDLIQGVTTVLISRPDEGRFTRLVTDQGDITNLDRNINATITSQDGIVFQVRLVNTEVQGGDAFANGVDIGDIVRESSGLVVVRFIDGTVQSLF